MKSEFGVSFDQAHHIKTTIINKWFPPSLTERIKGVDTLFRTDPQYERALSEQLPATGDDLKCLEKKYGGKYNAIIGQVLHPQQVSRFDTGFAVSHLAQFNVAPNEAVFEGTHWLMRYYATHPHFPIFYPRLNIKLHQSIQFKQDPGKYLEVPVPNLR